MEITRTKLANDIITIFSWYTMYAFSIGLFLPSFSDLPYTPKVFISTNVRHFHDLQVANLKVANFISKYIYLCYDGEPNALDKTSQFCWQIKACEHVF